MSWREAANHRHAERRPSERPTHAADFAFRNVLGESPLLREAIQLGRRVAAHPTTTVLLHGETGTGKELFARGIHHASANAGEPFVPIHCSALPEDLLESELFGHEKGAFRDAHFQKRGLLELAESGTVFLDEIGELPLTLQPKLLRVLEEKRARRIGGLEEQKIHCRIIAATTRDLARAVEEGTFREDLYDRLSVFRIDIPPLRERGADVALLARHFVETMVREHRLPPKTLSDDALRLLLAHAWRGNVRELRNTIERAFILSDGPVIDSEHIVIQQWSNVPATSAPVESEATAGVIVVPNTGMTLEEAERQLLALTLRLAGNNRTRAARMLGISRPTIIRKVQRYHLNGQ